MEVQQEFPKYNRYGKELNKKLNPDEAVAYGATIEAAMEMGEYAEDITLLDVCPFSLGIGVEVKKTYKDFGLEMNKVINKGSKLPLKKKKIFSQFLIINLLH